MKNRKGFTLVELLAMLVVLGILMAVTIPNITGILGNSRLNKTKNDATQIVETAKTRIAKDPSIPKPKNNECLILTLNFIDDNEEFTKGANGGDYQQFDSFVLYTREGSEYKYYLRLIEQEDGKYKGILLRDSKTIDAIKGQDIKPVNALYGLSDDREASISTLSAQTDIMDKCRTSIKYYVHKSS